MKLIFNSALLKLFIFSIFKLTYYFSSQELFHLFSHSAKLNSAQLNSTRFLLFFTRYQRLSKKLTFELIIFKFK